MNNSQEYFKVENKWFNSNKFKKRKLKNLIRFSRGVEPGSKNYGIEGEGKRFIRVNDVGSANKDKVFVKMETDAICSPGDILLCLDGSPGIVVKGFEGIYSTGLRKLVLLDKILNYDFLYYSLNCDFSQECINFFSKGTTIMHASSSTNYLMQPLPEPEEQIAIVKFLDEKTENIDKVIKNKKRQIEVIDQLHKIKINNLFSNSLSFNNELTPDVKWTENLPNKYKVVKLKKCLKKSLSNGLFKKKRFFGSGTLLVNVYDIYSSIFIDTLKLDRVQATKEEVDNYSISENDIFLTRSSLKLEGIAMCAMTNKLFEPTVYECHIIKLSPDEKIIDPKYLAFYLRYFANDMLISLSNTVTMTTISQPKINNIKVILPPLEIQKEKIKEIVSIYLNQINQTKILKEQIQKLEEYKKILINEAVTGKIKVIA